MLILDFSGNSDMQLVGGCYRLLNRVMKCSVIPVDLVMQFALLEGKLLLEIGLWQPFKRRPIRPMGKFTRQHRILRYRTYQRTIQHWVSKVRILKHLLSLNHISWS